MVIVQKRVLEESNKALNKEVRFKEPLREPGDSYIPENLPEAFISQTGEAAGLNEEALTA